MPHPDIDPDTLRAGIAKRYAFRPPTPEAEFFKGLPRFVDDWMEKNLTPLSPDADDSKETWLNNCRYTQSRKEELLRVWKENPVLLPEHYKCKGFMKDETYPDFKHARAINSRHDRFKIEVGPMFKLIEEQVYQHPAFIKHVPVADRPRFIRDLIYSVGSKYIATDYTAFESLFVRKLMAAVEMRLYKYMTKFHPSGKAWYETVAKAMLGKNTIAYKWFTVMVDATRMSGEMCTSLGNGFSNLMFMLYICSKIGSQAIGCVEGDDGIFRIIGDIPTAQMFEKLGLKIKLEIHTDLCTASFCGIIFDPEECINVTDPREVLASFGWTTARYARCKKSRAKLLLRSKALSYLHQYPGCPIIQELALYGLRVTKSSDIRAFVQEKLVTNLWEREQLLDAIDSGITHKSAVPVGLRTRLLVERIYGISAELQMSIEKYLHNLNDIQPLDIPCFDLMVPRPWIEYFERYQIPHESPTRIFPDINKHMDVPL
jgi:hypothetical protein